MRSIANALCSLALVGMSLLGLWKGVDYSGWVLAVGLLVALNT